MCNMQESDSDESLPLGLLCLFETESSETFSRTRIRKLEQNCVLAFEFEVLEKDSLHKHTQIIVFMAV